VLRNGQVIGTAAITDLTQADLIRMISGVTVERYRRAPSKTGKPVLSIRNLTRGKAYSDVNLTIHAGEVVGLTGLEGSGPGALARGLFGLEPLGNGEVSIDGKSYEHGSPSRALHQGLAYLPRDRHGLGIVASRSVRDNVSLSVLGKLQRRFGLINRAGERRLVQNYIDALGIVTPSMATAIENLSGGNQQKAVVAKLAATEPRVLLLDEPTQGVDVQAKVELLRIVDELSKRGVAVGVVSDELSELMDICDRIIVFYRGRIVREFRRDSDQITTVKLLEAIEGETAEKNHAMV
jgi:ABC-type sugar transport system ATPase subunit